MIALVAKHEVDHVTVAGAFLVTLLALTTSGHPLIALRGGSCQSAGRDSAAVPAKQAEGQLTRILRSRQLEQPLEGLPQ